MRERVFVSFYDRGNLGDDLLFRALVDRHPGVDFHYLESGAGATFFGRELSNVHGWSLVRYADSVLRRLRIPWRLAPSARRWLIRRSRLAVRIGGSLYMERGQWRLDAELDAELLQARAGACFINGNFGPWQSPEFLARYTDTFSRAIDVTVRDKASLAQLAAIPTVRLAPDLIFTTVPPAPSAEPVGVLISVIDLAGRDELAARREPYEAALAALITHLVAAGEQVTVMSFCAYEGDEVAAARVLGRLAPQVRAGVGTHFYRGDLEAALTAMAGARAVLATRFHAMVLGLTFGRRVCTIAYSDKTAQALDDLGLERNGWTLEEFSKEPSTEVARRLVEPGTELPDVIRIAADGHFQVLDRLLAETKEQQ